MAQKYYHNDYKKLLGVDQTRTASEKLLDRAIGRQRPVAEPKDEKPAEKKVKQEASSLTHAEVLAKITKNIAANTNAGKLLKPLGILKKCLEDKSFIANPEVNKLEQWIDLLQLLLAVDQRMIGNYGEILPANERLLQIFTLFAGILAPFSIRQLNEPFQEVKKEEREVQIKKEEQPQKKLNLYIQICEFQPMYYKLFTDDNFSFNKTLQEFKKRYFSFFQSLLQGKKQSASQQHLLYMSNLLLKVFKLPYTKYQWIKSSLSQFFKEFNIHYKHLLNNQLTDQYLQTYNSFINQKGGHSGGQDVHIFGETSKGGKITAVQVVKSDGFDTWASKQ